MELDADFDVIEMMRLLGRRKWTLLLSGLVCAGVTFAISLSMPRRYSAEGSLLVRSEALTAPETDAAFYSSALNEAAVTTEQEVLTSEGLLRRVADKLDLSPAMVEQPSIIDRLSGLVEYGAARISGPTLEQRIQTTLQAWFPPTAETPASLSQARTRFVATALTIAANKSSSVVALRAVTKSPQLSADIVNEVADLYMQDRLAEQGRTASTIEQALRERLRQTRMQIAEGEDRLIKVLQEPGALENSEVPGLMQNMSLLTVQLAQAQVDLARKQSEFEAAVHMRERGGSGGAADSLSYMVSGDLRRQLSTLQQESARLGAKYQAEMPANRAVQQQISVVESAIAAEASRGIEQRRTEMAAAQATVDSLQQQVDAARNRRLSQASSTLDVDQQRQAVASLWKISDALETRLIDLAARPVNPNARILSVANPPARASFPNKGMITFAGLMLGTVGAGAFVVVANHMRRLRPLAIHLAQQMKAPLLGGLPQVSGRLASQRRLLRSAVAQDSRDGLAVTIRALALELEDTLHQDKIGYLMVTSAKPGEGKTTVAIALGRALAMISTRVLLIDFDLRRPSVERVLAASTGGNLEDYEQPLSPQTALHVKRDRQSGLHVLTPSKGTDPISYLRSTALRDWILQARDKYDLIIFDTPPVMAVPDALEVARLADAILLVSELGRSDEADRLELSRRLARTRKPICGLVVTKLEDLDANAGSYSGYGLRMGGQGNAQLERASQP